MVTAVMWNMNEGSRSSRSVDVDLEAKAGDVIQLMSTLTGIKSLGVFFLGQRIDANIQLKDVCGLRAHHRIYVMRVTDVGDSTNRRTTMHEIDVIRTNWHNAFMQHRELLMKMTSNRESMTSLIGSTPGLRTDRVAQSLLQDPLLLLIWLSNKDVEKLANEHPSIIDACQQITSALHAEIARSPPISSMLDDDDESSSNEDQDEGAAGAAQPPRHRRRQQQQRQFLQPNQDRAGPFTREQLAAALAAVGGVGQRRVIAPHPPPPSAPPPSNRAITTDMLRQAMNNALGGTFTAAPAASTDNNNYTAEMAELIGMGFTNEIENMQALRASGGSVQLALEYIINERERQMPLD